MTHKLHLDRILLVCMIFIMAISFLALATTTGPFSINAGKESNYYLFHQIGFGLIPGLLLGFLAYKIDINRIRKLTPLFFLLTCVAMSLIVTPLGIEEGGATRWVDLGFTSFQPVEFLKISSILFLAYLLSSDRKTSNNVKRFLLLSAPVILFVAFVQSDLGTAGALFVVLFAMFFCSKTKLKHILLVGLLAIAVFVSAIVTSPYRMERITTFFNPESQDQLDESYHIDSAIMSIGSGGLTGSGIGMGAQKYGDVPESISDSIFTIFAEETGFIGCFVLLLLFLIFTYRTFLISTRHVSFEKLVCIGIGTWISIQAFMNIMAMTGLIPLTGIPMPFISYGGTHVIAELMAVGIILNISKIPKQI